MKQYWQEKQIINKISNDWISKIHINLKFIQNQTTLPPLYTFPLFKQINRTTSFRILTIFYNITSKIENFYTITNQLL